MGAPGRAAGGARDFWNDKFTKSKTTHALTRMPYSHPQKWRGAAWGGIFHTCALHTQVTLREPVRRPAALEVVLLDRGPRRRDAPFCRLSVHRRARLVADSIFVTQMVAAAPSLEHLSRLLSVLESSTDERASHGTAAAMRRAIHTVSGNASIELARRYARAYRAVLAESTLGFLHLSKSGGTSVCELAKLNGCSRAAAGQSTFNGNCIDPFLMDGPWWMPPDVISKLEPGGLRSFADRSFRLMPRTLNVVHSCRNRGRRGQLLWFHPPRLPPTFFAIEGAAPEGRRCTGILDMLVLREPVERLGSFGRELIRWGLLPCASDCTASRVRNWPGAPASCSCECNRCDCDTQRGELWPARKVRCDQLRRSVCGNYSLMASFAPPVYDNQLTRVLLGPEVYRLPLGAITRDHYLQARERLRGVDVLLVLGPHLERAFVQRLGWTSRGLHDKYRRQSTPPAVGRRLSDAEPRAMRHPVGSSPERRAGARRQLSRHLRRHQPAASATARASLPCTFGVDIVGMEEVARVANRWDALLYAEAMELEAVDAAFFARDEVRAALGAGAARGGREMGVVAASLPVAAAAAHATAASGAAKDGEAVVGSLAQCGLLADTAAPEADAALGWPEALLPMCIYQRFRNGCCWSTGLNTHASPMPALPRPFRCVLPPAGQHSRQTSVRLPAVATKHHHGSCALSCAEHEVFGLEEAGGFCMCLSMAEAEQATALSDHECQPACSAALRLHSTHQNEAESLPCGGSEAVALFDTRAVLKAMALGSGASEHSSDGAASYAATSAESQGGSARRGLARNLARELCAPMADPCTSAATAPATGAQQRVRSLYVHLSEALRARIDVTGVAHHRVLLGCFADAQLQRHGVARRPSATAPDGGALEEGNAFRSSRSSSGGSRSGGSSGSSYDIRVLSCSQACSQHTFFALGSERLVGGPCLCGELPLVTWKRDAQGIDGLRKIALWTVRPKAPASALRVA